MLRIFFFTLNGDILNKETWRSGNDGVLLVTVAKPGQRTLLSDGVRWVKANRLYRVPGKIKMLISCRYDPLRECVKITHSLPLTESTNSWQAEQKC